MPGITLARSYLPLPEEALGSSADLDIYCRDGVCLGAASLLSAASRTMRRLLSELQIRNEGHHTILDRNVALSLPDCTTHQVDLLMHFLLRGWLPASLANARHLKKMLALLHIDLVGIEQVQLHLGEVISQSVEAEEEERDLVELQPQIVVKVEEEEEDEQMCVESDSSLSVQIEGIVSMGEQENCHPAAAEYQAHHGLPLPAMDSWTVGRRDAADQNVHHWDQVNLGNEEHDKSSNISSLSVPVASREEEHTASGFSLSGEPLQPYRGGKLRCCCSGCGFVARHSNGIVKHLLSKHQTSRDFLGEVAIFEDRTQRLRGLFDLFPFVVKCLACETIRCSAIKIGTAVQNMREHIIQEHGADHSTYKKLMTFMRKLDSGQLAYSTNSPHCPGPRARNKLLKLKKHESESSAKKILDKTLPLQPTINHSKSHANGNGAYSNSPSGSGGDSAAGSSRQSSQSPAQAVSEAANQPSSEHHLRCGVCQVPLPAVTVVQLHWRREHPDRPLLTAVLLDASGRQLSIFDVLPFVFMCRICNVFRMSARSRGSALQTMRVHLMKEHDTNSKEFMLRVKSGPEGLEWSAVRQPRRYVRKSPKKELATLPKVQDIRIQLKRLQPAEVERHTLARSPSPDTPEENPGQVTTEFHLAEGNGQLWIQSDDQVLGGGRGEDVHGGEGGGAEDAVEEEDGDDRMVDDDGMDDDDDDDERDQPEDSTVRVASQLAQDLPVLC